MVGHANCAYENAVEREISRVSTAFVRVGTKQYTVLMAKARAHDQYLRACQLMGVQQFRMFARADEFSKGYLAAIRDFGNAVVTAAAEGDNE